jgi:hypothetical protein
MREGATKERLRDPEDLKDENMKDPSTVDSIRRKRKTLSDLQPHPAVTTAGKPKSSSVQTLPNRVS